ncbi:MAG TPA: LysR family transcriptional regulator [Methylibium sp.]|uniref:LysR family transcriptional regulator n=1 Tax=Methylibium sp. TaxID=2067992 RepID=UPI002DB5E891|nr:LysR family transcriptional regulator [Methylibium sp.]HEU4460055.1 LysR family transcriptional regulator [Methylibium sp.]
MRFNKLDLNLLVALDAMLNEASISRAAERLHISQSATSNALARLRDYFGDELLVQVGRRMELTPRAEVLREAVRDVLVRVDTTIAAQPEFVPAEADREFRILVSDYTLTMLCPHLVALAAAEAKGVRLRLSPQVENPQRVLERGEADLLVIPQAYCSPDHPTESLWREDFVCVVWNGSTHAQRTLSFERYCEAGHVVMQPGNMSQLSFETWFLQRFGVARRIEVATHTFSSVPALVVGTDRIATMHKRLAQVAQASLPIKLIPTPMQVPAMEQAVQWHKYRTQDPGLVWLRGVMRRGVERMEGA